jgi:thymidylate kinase
MKMKIIVIEGCDALGKSTQINRIIIELEKLGYSVIDEKFPRSGFCYHLIRKMLNSGSARKFPNIFQILNFLNKLSFQLFVFPKIKCDYLIIDRWNFSLLAYGLADHANKFFTKLFFQFLISPDLVFLFDGKRFNRELQDDSYDCDKNYQKVVRSCYLTASLSSSNTDIIVIDCNQEIENLTKKIVLNILEKQFIIKT